MSRQHNDRESADERRPLYLTLADTLRERLANCSAGEYLPSEAVLANQFQVNRHTLRRAMDELIAEGRVLRRKGRGTCVLPSPIVYPLDAQSAHSATLEGLGLRSTALLLDKRVRSAKSDEIADLRLGPHERVVEFDTLRLVDDRPISLISHCFAERHGALMRSYQGGSVRGHLARQGVVLRRVSTLIGARAPSQNVAFQLMMPRHTPLLTIRTLSADPDGRPFEVSRSLSRADRFNYQVESGEHRDEQI